jgi:DNA polymerase (family X)
VAQTKPGNEEIARLLERIASLLEGPEENPFRARAYRSAAQTVRQAPDSVADLARKEDLGDLTRLPGIGEGLAAVIVEYVTKEKSSLLQELERQADPAAVFSRIPGLGPELAERILKDLDIHTLEELELAAHDGRLEQVPGFGPQRVESVRLGLAALLSGSARSRAKRPRPQADAPQERPPVDLLLEIDAEYRRKAEAGELRRIGPKRFNPRGEAWLPVMEIQRDGWRFTVLFSNTKQAHEAGKTHDWVVIYFRKGDQPERQHTVVTETKGTKAGQRVVRGRELPSPSQV